MRETHSIAKEFVVLDVEKQATIEPFDSTLYARLEKKYDRFKDCELISCYQFSSDWPTWEIHPNGDEIVILLSGEATFILQLEDAEKSLSLTHAGSYIIIPKNTWHRATTGMETEMLFITPGEGTRNKTVC